MSCCSLGGLYKCNLAQRLFGYFSFYLDHSLTGAFANNTCKSSARFRRIISIEHWESRGHTNWADHGFSGQRRHGLHSDPEHATKSPRPEAHCTGWHPCSHGGSVGEGRLSGHAWEAWGSGFKPFLATVLSAQWAKLTVGVQLHGEYGNPPRPACIRATRNFQVCPGTKRGYGSCPQGVAQPATSLDRLVSRPGPKGLPWLPAVVSQPSYNVAKPPGISYSFVSVPSPGDLLLVPGAQSLRQGEAQGHQHKMGSGLDPVRGPASPCRWHSLWPLGSAGLNNEHRLGGQTHHDRGGPGCPWEMGIYTSGANTGLQRCGCGPPSPSPRPTCCPDRHSPGSRKGRTNILPMRPIVRES